MGDEKTVISAFELSYGQRSHPVYYFAILGTLLVIFGLVGSLVPMQNKTFEIRYDQTW